MMCGKSIRHGSGFRGYRRTSIHVRCSLTFVCIAVPAMPAGPGRRAARSAARVRFCFARFHAHPPAGRVGTPAARGGGGRPHFRGLDAPRRIFWGAQRAHSFCSHGSTCTMVRQPARGRAPRGASRCLLRALTGERGRGAAAEAHPDQGPRALADHGQVQPRRGPVLLVQQGQSPQRVVRAQRGAVGHVRRAQRHSVEHRCVLCVPAPQTPFLGAGVLRLRTMRRFFFVVPGVAG